MKKVFLMFLLTLTLSSEICLPSTVPTPTTPAKIPEGLEPLPATISSLPTLPTPTTPVQIPEGLAPLPETPASISPTTPTQTTSTSSTSTSSTSTSSSSSSSSISKALSPAELEKILKEFDIANINQRYNLIIKIAQNIEADANFNVIFYLFLNILFANCLQEDYSPLIYFRGPFRDFLEKLNKRIIEFAKKDFQSFENLFNEISLIFINHGHTILKTATNADLALLARNYFKTIADEFSSSSYSPDEMRFEDKRKFEQLENGRKIIKALANIYWGDTKNILTTGRSKIAYYEEAWKLIQKYIYETGIDFSQLRQQFEFSESFIAWVQRSQAQAPYLYIQHPQTTSSSSSSSSSSSDSPVSFSNTAPDPQSSSFFSSHSDPVEVLKMFFEALKKTDKQEAKNLIKELLSRNPQISASSDPDGTGVGFFFSAGSIYSTMKIPIPLSYASASTLKKLNSILRDLSTNFHNKNEIEFNKLFDQLVLLLSPSTWSLWRPSTWFGGGGSSSSNQ